MTDQNGGPTRVPPSPTTVPVSTQDPTLYELMRLVLISPDISTTTRVHSRWVTSAIRRLRCERYAAWFLCC
jgi:hypothetical protein